MKSLKKTQRLVIIGTSDKFDKSKCCNAEIRMSRVATMGMSCSECKKEIKFEEQINWKKKKASYESAY